MPLHVVLYSPEIPQNTGNIMRTCAATNAKLHLIEPMGFRMDEKYVKRSSANNIENVDYTVYIDWEEFIQKNSGEYVFLTRYGKNPHSTHDFTDVNKNIYLIFGRESTGIPKEIIQDYLDTCYRIPMASNVRSLNLSNCVAIMIYEALRQQNYNGLSKVEVIKGENYIYDL